jgi:hypothetical protein
MVLKVSAVVCTRSRPKYGALLKYNDQGIYYGKESALEKKIQGYPQVFTYEKF